MSAKPKRGWWHGREPSAKKYERPIGQLKSRRPPMCEGCGVNRSDPPGKLCVGCEAYKEHQA